MPLEKPLVITTQDVKQAELDKLGSFAAAAGVVAGITALNYRFNAPLGRFVQKGVQLGFTGIEAKPTASGRAAVRVPTPSLFAFALPTPVGFVPGEFYGLHPAVVRRTLGIGAGKKPPIFEPSDERKRVFDATIEAERIAGRVLNKPVLFGRASGFPFFTLPPGKLNITPEEFQFLESLPPGLTNAQRLLPELAQRRTDFILTGGAPTSGHRFETGGVGPRGILHIEGADTGITRAAVIPASVQAAAVRATNAKAIAAAAMAIGVRKQLVAERADP